MPDDLTEIFEDHFGCTLEEAKSAVSAGYNPYPYRIEAFAAVYPDGEVEGVYTTRGHAERSTAGDDVEIIRLVPETQDIIKEALGL